MVKSDIRKTRSKSVVTNINVSFFDATGLQASVAESGDRIYVIPRKGQVILKSLFWTQFLETDPADHSITYTILRHERNDTNMGLSELELVQRAIVVAHMAFRSVTAVGVILTSDTQDVNLHDVEIARRTNLQSDDDYSIVPAFFSTVTTNIAVSGTLFVEETRFQDILRDDPTEWAGYTFEESAQ